MEGPVAHPNAELYIRVPTSDAAELVGRRFLVPRSWDESVDDHVSCLYYYEHEDLDDNEIHFLERAGTTVRVRWTGSAPSLAAQGEPKPTVVIDAWFALEGPSGLADA
jgi:hypothetical protein